MLSLPSHCSQNGISPHGNPRRQAGVGRACPEAGLGARAQSTLRTEDSSPICRASRAAPAPGPFLAGSLLVSGKYWAGCRWQAAVQQVEEVPLSTLQDVQTSPSRTLGLPGQEVDFLRRSLSLVAVSRALRACHVKPASACPASLFLRRMASPPGTVPRKRLQELLQEMTEHKFPRNGFEAACTVTVVRSTG